MNVVGQHLPPAMQSRPRGTVGASPFLLPGLVFLVLHVLQTAQSDLLYCCRCHVTEECFAHMTAMLQPIAPLAVLLEGGYNLSATAAATEACLRVLLGERPPVLPFEQRAPCFSGVAVIQQVMRTQVTGCPLSVSSCRASKGGCAHVVHRATSLHMSGCNAGRLAAAV